jgi:hypothetical protein
MNEVTLAEEAPPGCVRLTLSYPVPTVTPLPAETREEHLNRGQRLIRDHTRPPLEADRIRCLVTH